MHILFDSLGSPDKLNNVGIDGPKMSVSKMPALNPSLANASDRFANIVNEELEIALGVRSLPATVLFPTPPFADDTAITLSTPAILRFSGFFGQWGGVPALGKPY